MGYDLEGTIEPQRGPPAYADARKSTMTYQLSEVQATQDSRGAFEGVGFNILNERGEPIVTFGYLDPIDAAGARGLIEKAIVDAVLITGARR